MREILDKLPPHGRHHVAVLGQQNIRVHIRIARRAGIVNGAKAGADGLAHRVRRLHHRAGDVGIWQHRGAETLGLQHAARSVHAAIIPPKSAPHGAAGIHSLHPSRVVNGAFQRGGNLPRRAGQSVIASR